MDDLKPRECPSPWCRSTVIETLFSPWSKRFYAKCQSCKAEGPVGAAEADAIAAWNTRPTEDALRAEIARLREKQRQAYQESATAAYIVCAETRHVTLGDKCRAAIEALGEQP